MNLQLGAADWTAMLMVPDWIDRDLGAAGDLRPLFAKLGARGAGKALVSLEALRELSLLEQRETPQGARWCLVPTAGKKDLASAPILRRLEAAQ